MRPNGTLFRSIHRRQYRAERVEADGLDGSTVGGENNQPKIAWKIHLIYSRMFLESRYENATRVPNVNRPVGRAGRNVTAVGVERDARKITRDFVVIVTE